MSSEPQPSAKPAGELHVVTGAAGFLGTHLLTALNAAGHRTLGIDITPPGPEDHWVQADCIDLAAMRTLLRGADVVHHTVAHVPLRRPSTASLEANAISPGVIAEACHLEGVRQLVLVGSSAVYGLPPVSPLPESAPAAPFERYGRDKLAGENAARAALATSNTRLAVLRPRTILGRGRLGIFHTLFQFIQEGRNVYTIGPANGPLQFVHVDDVIAAHLILAQGADGIFAVGTDNYTTLHDELAELIEYAGSASKMVALPSRLTRIVLALLWRLHLSPLSPWHYEGYAHPFDVTTDGLQALGWKPTYSNTELLIDAWNSFTAPNSPSEHSSHTATSVHMSSLRQQALGFIRRIS